MSNHRVISVLLIVSLLFAYGTACGVSPRLPVQSKSPARIQCSFQGEVVFDRMFDRAEVRPDGKIIVWLDNQSAEVDGECTIVG